jgi:type I restriction enzyme S subunit
MIEWRDTKLGGFIELKRGYDLPKRERRDGPFPIVSSSGISGSHSEAKVLGPGVVTGRYGTLGRVYYISGDFWPLNTSLYVRDFKSNSPRFVASLLESMDLAQHDGAAAVPGLNRNQLHELPVRVPDRAGQDRIAGIMKAIEDLIENGRRRVGVLEEITQTLYREWFVHFRYPGHELAAFVDSSLGLLPEGWRVDAVAALASTERNAVTGGPFGSRLGRRDYMDSGVPVLRGGNLRVGGGFDETELVFVSDAKADELRSSLASRGDVIITQRGTLGQIGLIPGSSAFDRYVLSQSQMKVTVDPTKSSAEFVYEQMRQPETTDRFIAQAMSSGVPHVNLSLLRDFELVVPPHALQMAFTERARALSLQSWALRREAASLTSLRILLLPKLVTGQIDVSSLDLDSVLEGSVG